MDQKSMAGLLPHCPRSLYNASTLCLSRMLVYVVYMGSKNGEDPDEILTQNHEMLAFVHTGSMEEARASHLYSYRHGFRGFAAKLTDLQAFQISKMPGVVSVFPNSKRKLHTTHSWDFMGLLGEKKPWRLLGFPGPGAM
ncbi:hypothetical protein ACFX2H_012267 [Malus domestica]